MKVDEIRQKTVNEIEVEVESAREELMRMRFQISTGELTDHSQLSINRRKIARLLTILDEKKREGSAELEGEA